MTRLGVIKSDEVSYSYVFVHGSVYVTIWNNGEIVSSPIIP
jgi:hypothetical protein